MFGCLCTLLRFNTPLFYSDARLQELSGTTLAAAAAARKASLSRSWQQLKPAVQAMMEQVGAILDLIGCHRLVKAQSLYDLAVPSPQ